ncbi:MAG: hypothetical protein CSB49_01160 [Proteobacteria bacterium]|nr:MAG: hypothetical protein CSB49_01160 [Pseudomonadota bacterium]
MRHSAQPSARALFVPGAALWPDGSPRAALRARLEAALAAAREDPTTLVLVSGGGPSCAKDAESRRRSEEGACW